jgi:hypothetical protein
MPSDSETICTLSSHSLILVAGGLVMRPAFLAGLGVVPGLSSTFRESDSNSLYISLYIFIYAYLPWGIYHRLISGVIN